MQYEPSYPASKGALREELLSILSNRDFVEFCKFVRITPKDGQAIAFSYDKWFPAQRAFQRQRTRKDVVLKPRQVGFSTMEFIRDLFYALTHPNSTVAILATDDELAKDFLRRIRDVYSYLSELDSKVFPPLDPNRFKKIIAQANKLRLHNGSYILAISAGATEHTADKAARGSSINRLHCSEVAFWKEPDATMRAAFQAVPKTLDSEVVIESTPNGLGTFFSKFVQKASEGENGYKLHFYPWFEHPEHKATLIPDRVFEPRNPYEHKLLKLNLAPERLWFFRQQSETVGLNAVLSEYPSDPYSCFVATGNMFLSPEEHQHLESIIQPPIHVAYIDSIPMRIWEHPQEGADYIVACDIAGGTGGDNSVAYVMNRKSMQLAALLVTNNLLPKHFGKLAITIATQYNDAFFVHENNSFGESVADALREERYTRCYKRKLPNGNRAIGWITNSATRPRLIETLKETIQDQTLTRLDADLFRELTLLEVLPTGRIQAKGKGKDGKDDRVFALALALTIRAEAKPKLTSTGYQSLGKVNSPAKGILW
ncbi:MAG: hypothetical protein RIE23_07935 [Pontimonas sp.]